MFNQTRVIRSFMSHDLPGRVTVSPCNIETGEVTNTSYDPNYPDMVISCSDYNLNKVVPVIEGKMRYCSWVNSLIYLKNSVDLIRYTDQVTFVSFGDMNIKLQRLSDLSSDGWNILPGTIPILILGGSVYYEPSNMFKIDTNKNKIVLNEQFVLEEFKKRGFASIEDVVDNLDSFVIFVIAKRLLIRDIDLISVTNNKALQFVYHEDGVQEHHVDYLCINNEDDTVRGITIADDKYKNVVTKQDQKEHHLYADSGSGNMRLIQLTVC